jgi:hypothetical protein
VLFANGPNPAGDVALAHVASKLTLTLGGSSVKKNRPLRVSGTLSPRHAGGAQIRISLWRRVGTTWKSYPAVTVSTTDNGARTTFSRTVTLNAAGTWRLRASHTADSHHMAALTSGYATVTVK